MKTKGLKITAMLLILVGSIWVFSCEKPDITTDETTQLQGTKWKLAGIVDPETGVLSELEPKDCAECYTLEFDTDNTFLTFTPANELEGRYVADYESHSFRIIYFGGTKVGEIGDADLYSTPFGDKTFQSFSIQENELRLYYNDGKNYLEYKENNDVNNSCKFNNPLIDLPWLKEKVDEITLIIQNGNPLSVSIYQCVYDNGKTGFLIDEGNTKPFHNCSGEVLCIMGGVAGETCSELNIVRQELIWTTDDLDVIIPCNFDNPLTDLPWLKSFIEDYPTLYTQSAKIYQCTYKNGTGFLCEIGDSGYILRGCHGAALCSKQDGDCKDFNIDFENKQLIWEYSKTNN